MKNADKFKAVFGLCAAKLWVMPEGEFSKWLNSESTETEQRWITCSERLPIGSDIVLLSLPPSINMNGDELVGGVICGHYIGGKNEIWGISDGSTFGYGLVSVKYGTNPTHWMPLPEPYQEGEQDETD